MERIKQHSMIVVPKEGSHPIFNLAFLPENLASLVETILFVYLWLNVLIFAVNFTYIANPGLLPDNAVTSIFQTSTGYYLNSLGLNNDLVTNQVALLVFFSIFIISRKYFEYIKYNLHVLRDPKDKV